MNIIKSYKGFDANFKCRGFQYEVGKTYQHKKPVKVCKSGFHACEYPLDVLKYYPPATSRFALVTQSGELSRHENDSKVASSEILIDVELSLTELIEETIDYIITRMKWSDEWAINDRQSRPNPQPMGSVIITVKRKDNVQR